MTRWTNDGVVLWLMRDVSRGATISRVAPKFKYRKWRQNRNIESGAKIDISRVAPKFEYGELGKKKKFGEIF